MALYDFFISTLITTIGMAIIYLLIQGFLAEIDKRLHLRKTEILLMAGILFLCTVLLNCKYETGLLFLAYTYLAYYLALTAYVDKKTSDVYCIFNYISLGIGTTFFCYRFFTVLNKPVTLFALIIILFMLIFVKILHLYGDGDGEIFLVISIFLLAGNNSFDCIYYIFMMYFLAILLITMAHLKEIDWKKMRFKQPIPFAPSIFAATVITILIM